MRKKSEITVQDAVIKVWNDMPEVVHTVIFFLNVRRITGRPSLPDGTISRKLRLARAEGLLNYEVINHEMSIYKKIE